MGKTERRLRKSTHPEGPSPAQGNPYPLELQVRVPCKGRKASEVLEDLGRGLADAGARGRDPLIVLEDLGQLADSVTSLIKGLSRLIVGFPRTVTFWEASGYTEAFLSVMDAQTPPKVDPPPQPGLR